MTFIKAIIPILLATSCNMSYYSSELSGGHVYVNEGEGMNQILPNSRKIQSLRFLKKYCDNGNYLCAWQADTALFQSTKFNYGEYKKNTYYSNDLFYIINIRKDTLMGPYKREKFFWTCQKLGIKVYWRP